MIPSERMPPSNDDERSAARDRALHIAWLYRVAQTALVRAREYRTEEGTPGARERECLDAVKAHRAQIKRLRAAPLHDNTIAPGLRKAEAIEHTGNARTGTAG
jgi:hypothetical protein